MINLTTSLAIQCMQHGLVARASALLLKGYKADLTLFEVRDHSLMMGKIIGWRGRVQLMNSLAFLSFKNKDYTSALRFNIEAQKIVSE